MDGEPVHHCPGCGTSLPRSPRYPWHFCRACLDTAEDCEGRQLRFFNVSLSGGLGWSYADDPSMMDDGSLGVVCLIRGRPVMVAESYFGGVVAQPLHYGPQQSAEIGIARLTESKGLTAARAELRPRRAK